MQPGTPTKLLKPGVASSARSAGPTEAPLVLPSQANFDGTSEVANSGSSVTLTVNGKTTGSVPLQLMVTVKGTMQATGGLGVSSGSVELTPPQGAATYRGTVTGLSDGNLLATLDDGHGDTIDVSIALTVPGQDPQRANHDQQRTDTGMTASAFPPAPGAVLLPEFTASGAWTTLSEHRSRFGRPPVARRGSEELIELTAAAGLRGRGGAAFPTATKMRAVAAGRRRPVVVANGSEGEPASHKDATVMTRAPHLVLDGALIAAAAVGADEIVVAVVTHTGSSRRAIAHAIEERYTAEPGGPTIRMVDVPTDYVAGEERALVNLINGGAAIPTSGPRPFERGVSGRPTLVQNVETLAHLAIVLRDGPDAFRRVGTSEMPGTMLVTLSGAVARPGIVEVPVGTSLMETIGAGRPPQTIGGVLVGGYAGAWLTPQAASVATLDRAGMAAVGGIVGCGAVIVAPEDACIVTETAAVMLWLADQTAGQCGPCVHGLASVSEAAATLANGTADRNVIARLARWGGQIEGRGACRYPDGAVRLMRSAIQAFAPDAKAHAAGSPCRGASGPRLLPLPALRWSA